jgi:hypothetical protein
MLFYENLKKERLVPSVVLLAGSIPFYYLCHDIRDSGSNASLMAECTGCRFCAKSLHRLVGKAGLIQPIFYSVLTYLINLIRFALVS